MKRVIVVSILPIIPVLLFAAFWYARTAWCGYVNREE